MCPGEFSEDLVEVSSGVTQTWLKVEDGGILYEGFPNAMVACYWLLESKAPTYDTADSGVMTAEMSFVLESEQNADLFIFAGN